MEETPGRHEPFVTSVTMPDGRFVVSAALPVHVEAETLSEAREAMFVAIPLTLLLASLFGWLLARHSLEPMVTMRERATGIGATNLGDRVPIRNPADEVGQLASVINDLLGTSFGRPLPSFSTKRVSRSRANTGTRRSTRTRCPSFATRAGVCA